MRLMKNVSTLSVFFLRLRELSPALESAHAVAYALKSAPSMRPDQVIIINLSGRGDKDVNTAIENIFMIKGLSMNRLEKKFSELKKLEQKAFIAYITAGDPSLDSTVKLVKEFENNGVDCVELGIPFSDPIADGPVNRRSCNACSP